MGTAGPGTTCFVPKTQLAACPQGHQLGPTLEQGMELGSTGMGEDEGLWWRWEGGWHAPGLW